MRIKRVLQGTALTALAAAAWMGAGTVDASAAEATDFPIAKVNGISTSGAITINTENSGYKEIMFGVASYNKGKQTVKIADSAWDVYEVKDSKSISIDLSKLSFTKDNYIAIRSESTDPIYIRIGASVTNQKTTYKAGKLDIQFKKTGENAGSLDPKTTDLEYRTTYSSWNDFKYNGSSEDMFTEYQSQGATLYVRAKASKSNSFTEVTKIKDAAGKEYTFYTGPLMPGKESKVNIKKMANGPSVSANYVTGEVKVPNNTQYRVIASGCSFSDIADGSGNSISIRNLLDLSDTTNKAATSGTIEVRKKATSTKPASKWTCVKIEIPAAPVFTTMVTGHTATAGALEVVDGIKIEPIKNTKGGKNEYSGKVNITAGSYDISVKIEGATKPITIKKGVTKKSIKVAADKKISIAKAGNKKTKDWISGYTDICTVK